MAPTVVTSPIESQLGGFEGGCCDGEAIYYARKALAENLDFSDQQVSIHCSVRFGRPRGGYKSCFKRPGGIGVGGNHGAVGAS